MEVSSVEWAKKASAKSAKDPYDVYKMVLYKWLGIHGKLMGMNVFYSNYTLSTATIIVWTSLYLSTIPLQYSVMTKDIKVAVECTDVLFLIIQVKLFDYFFHTVIVS